MCLLLVDLEIEVSTSLLIKEKVAECGVMWANGAVCLGRDMENRIQIRQRLTDMTWRTTEQLCQGVCRKRREEGDNTSKNLSQHTIQFLLLLVVVALLNRIFKNGNVNLV
jgi:hypothetical protein